MKVLIIEDELLAQAKLESLLQSIDPGIEIAGKLGSVKEAVEWLAQQTHPDAAFVDIQLSDDHSFEIFRRCPVEFPVIFTTAFDKYLLESFEFNSIDYLLKPITAEKLQRSLAKLKKLEQHFVQGNLQKLVKQTSSGEARKIIVRKGGEFVAIDLADTAYFFTEHRIVFLKTFSGQQFLVDKNLAELESILDPQAFFRINRKFIANREAIEKFKPDAGKIRVFLKPVIKEEVHVSKEGAPEFRKWIGAT